MRSAHRRGGQSKLDERGSVADRAEETSREMVDEAKRLLENFRQRRWVAYIPTATISLLLVLTLMGFALVVVTLLQRQAEQLKLLHAANAELVSSVDKAATQFEQAGLDFLRVKDLEHAVSKTGTVSRVNERLHDLDHIVGKLEMGHERLLEAKQGLAEELRTSNDKLKRFVRSRREVIVIYAMHSSEPHITSAVVEPAVAEIEPFVSTAQQLFAWNQKLQPFDEHAAVDSPNSPEPISWSAGDVEDKARASLRHLLVITNKDIGEFPDQLKDDHAFRRCEKLTVLAVHASEHSPAFKNWTQIVTRFQQFKNDDVKVASLKIVPCKMNDADGNKKALDEKSLALLVEHIEAAIIPES